MNALIVGNRDRFGNRRRASRRPAAPGLLAALLMVTAAVAAAGCGRQSPGDPVELLQRASAAMGSPGDLLAAGGLTIVAEGTMDKAAEHQGSRPGARDPGPFGEEWSLLPSGDMVYAYRENRFDGTFEALRQVFTADGEQRIVVPDIRQVIRLRSDAIAGTRRRLLRRLPALLAGEALAQPEALQWMGREAGESRIEWTPPAGPPLTLRFDDERGVLTSVSYPMDMPSFGDVTVAWRFSDYERVEGVGLFPRRYACTIDGRPFLDMTVTDVAAGAGADAAAVPEDYAMGDQVEGPAADDASAEAAVSTAADGVHRVTRLRAGFHPMFVEFDDFVVAIDAPAGYPLLTELPAGDVAPGPSSAWLSERYISLIRGAIPDKPIRYVVLTHHHGDHMGGVRAFIAAGATVLAPPDAAALVERLVAAPHTIAPDELARAARPATVEVVRGERDITDGRRTLRLIDVGANPHGTEMLVAHLPADGIMFVSDLLDPTRVDRFPKPGHAALDRFFAGWLERTGLEPDRIYTMHGSGLVTPEHLARLREP